MSDALSIRQEQNGDHQAVHELLIRAFGQEDEAILVESLRKDAAFVPELSLVASKDDQLVGHILFTKINITNEDQACESLALAPVSVDPAHQGCGIGGALIQAGLSTCLSHGFESVIVLGHAMYYPRFGFTPTTQWQITAPFDVPAEVFMGIELVPGSLEKCAGEVQYSAPFGI